MTDKYDFYCEEILSGKTPVKKLYESERVIAYPHTKPSWETHIVIFPREHIPSLLDLTEKHDETILEIITVAKKLAKDLDMDKGVRLLTNLGKFQDTPHLHFHLICGEKIK